MIETSGAEVLANRERLLKALPSGEGLHGIITTDRADGLLYVLTIRRSGVVVAEIEEHGKPE